MRFHLLGSVAAVANGVESTPRSRHQVVLLAALLFAEGAPVSIEHLAGCVWADDPPADERAALQVAVSRLRRWLGEIGAKAEVRHTAAGYALDLHGAWLDLREFRRQVAEARRRSLPADRCRAFRSAMALWRGPVPAEVTGRLRESAPVLALVSEHRRAACEYADASVSAGEPGAAVALLEALAGEDRYAEDVHAALALALAAAGRRADAIAVVDRIRHRLADELGVDPGPELADAHVRVLRGEVVAPPPPRTVAWGLRPEPVDLLGRDPELRLLAESLSISRLVTVTGPAGCGKTALVRTAANADHRAVAVVDLGSVTGRVSALAALGAVFQIGTDDSDGVLAEISAAIGAAPALLVLDGCERVRASAAEIARHLLARCPGLHVLATSQQALEVDGEQLVPLAPLPVPVEFDEDNPAIALFLRRARADAPDLALDEQSTVAITAICARLDGLPLALELAAGWVRSLGVVELTRRLSRGIGLLSRVHRGAGATLTAAIGWSFDSLPQPERTVLIRFAIFEEPFSLTDAEQVCGFEPLREDEVAVHLAGLVARSLVQRVSTTPLRYALLAAVQEHAGTALHDSGEFDAVLRRHLAHWRSVFRAADAITDHWDRERVLAGLAADAPRLHHALVLATESGLAVEAAEITSLAGDFWWSHGAYLPLARQFLDHALSVVDRCDPETAALVRYYQAWWTRLAGDCAGSIVEMESVLDPLRRSRPREYLTARIFGLTTRRYMVCPEALDLAADVVGAVTESGVADAGEIAAALTAAGWVQATWGRWDAALALCRRYELHNRRREQRASMPQLVLRAEIAMATADAEGAARWLAEVSNRLDPVRDPDEQEPARAALAKGMLLAGRVTEAVEFLTDGVATMTAAYPQTLRRSAQLSILLAEAHRKAGAVDDCRAALTGALATLTGLSDYQIALPAVLVAATLAEATGDAVTAERIGGRWNDLRDRLGLPVPTGFALPPGVESGAPDAPVGWPTGELDGLIEDAYLSTAMLG